MFPDHGANNFLSLNSNLEAKIALSSAIVMSAYSFFNENTREFAFDVMACAKGFGIFVIVDAGSVAPMARTGVGLVRSFLNLADLVVANAQEFDLLTADLHGKTWFESVGNLVRKDGSAPAAWYSFGNEVTRVAPTPATVVDSTGAGDAFMAGLVRFLVTSQLAGEELARGALTSGHAVAALAVAQVGASPKVDSQS
jgi:sugar/nucleoside kinase (ribokinase family)